LIYVIECDLLRLPLRRVSSRTSYLRRSVFRTASHTFKVNEGDTAKSRKQRINIYKKWDLFGLWDL